jgi:hypothetical protein
MRIVACFNSAVSELASRFGFHDLHLEHMAARKKPPRTPLESDPYRPQNEPALAMGVQAKIIGKRFGYTPAAIIRFRDRMPAQLKAAIAAAALKPKEADLDKLRIEESEGILGNLAHQRARLLVCQDEAMEAGAVTQVGYLANVIHRNIELAGTYLGLFAQHHVSTNVNVLISEDYLRLRQAITLALRPFPDARRAVAEQLHTLEGQIAQKILDKHNASPSTVLAPMTIDAIAEPAP